MRGSMASVMPTSRRSAAQGQVERLCLQFAVGVAAGEQLGEVLRLQRLGAMEEIAASSLRWLVTAALLDEFR
eukprot:4529812-Pleurochrysis_carterae.AAC.1